MPNALPDISQNASSKIDKTTNVRLTAVEEKVESLVSSVSDKIDTLFAEITAVRNEVTSRASVQEESFANVRNELGANLAELQTHLDQQLSTDDGLMQDISNKLSQVQNYIQELSKTVSVSTANLTVSQPTVNVDTTIFVQKVEELANRQKDDLAALLTLVQKQQEAIAGVITTVLDLQNTTDEQYASTRDLLVLQQASNKELVDTVVEIAAKQAEASPVSTPTEVADEPIG